MIPPFTGPLGALWWGRCCRFMATWRGDFTSFRIFLWKTSPQRAENSLWVNISGIGKQFCFPRLWDHTGRGWRVYLKDCFPLALDRMMEWHFQRCVNFKKSLFTLKTGGKWRFGSGECCFPCSSWDGSHHNSGRGNFPPEMMENKP